MFCPQCGSTQSEDLKFCKVCGVNLYAVMQVVAAREPDEKFDWSKTWVQEMFLSADEKKRRKAEIEKQRGITPEIKRYNEIKAGIIVSSVGIAIAIFLFVFMGGLIASSKVSHDAAEILSRLWIAGVIPLFVGLALITNGVIVSKKLVEAARRGSQLGQEGLEGHANPPSLRPADTNEFLSTPFSVTEQTTKHLGRSGEK
ncbi:MAG TPA: zinc ribbon domain-containing protein [Pyrinomonadaceae bacterium]|nr:zinc ribbon domain-containing protein [Pyrinomonadaceae bacterium]